MSRIFICIAVFVAILYPMSVAAESPKGAEIEFQTNVIDLGELSQSDEIQIVRLAYTNTGDVPLVILFSTAQATGSK